MLHAKRFLISMTVMMALLVAVSSSVFAQKMNNDAGWVSVDEIALGGLVLGMTQDDVAAIYGQPDAVIDHGMNMEKGVPCSTWKYGDSLSLYLANGYVDSVDTNANNGIQTPAGIHVGSPVSDVWKAYGEPWMQRGESCWYHASKGCLFITVRNHKVTDVCIAYGND